MNEEIKEILDYLNKFINDKEEITKYGCEISVKEAKLLLDYITNLKKENEKLKLINEEYERLNKSQKRGFKITNVETYNINELLSYKSRIDKAIDNIDKLEQGVLNKVIISLNQFVPGLNQIKNDLKGNDKE